MEDLKDDLLAEPMDVQNSCSAPNRQVDGNYIMNHPLLIEEVASLVLRCLPCQDLKTTRLVCKEWNRMSDQYYANKSIVGTRFGKKYPKQAEVDAEYENKFYYSQSDNCSFKIRNIQLSTFELPTDYLSERSKLLWGRLKTLKIQDIGYHECEYLFRFCYNMMPQLNELHITCNGSAYISYNRDSRFRCDVPELPKNIEKPGRNLRSFTWLGCYSGFTAYKNFDSDPWMKYLQQCPLLSEITLDFSDRERLNRVVRNFMELRQRCASTHKISKVSIKLWNPLLFDEQIDFILNQLKSLYTSFPIRHMHCAVQRFTKYIDWPRLLAHFPPGLETLGIRVDSVYNDANLWTDWNSNVLTDLRKFEFNLGLREGQRLGWENYDSNNNPHYAVGAEPQFSFPNLIHLKWKAPLAFLPRSCPQKLASSCPVLEALCIGLKDKNEIDKIVSSFKSHSMLEEFEVSLGYSDFTDSEIVGGLKLKSPSGPGRIQKSYLSSGIVEMKSVKRLRLKSGYFSLTNKSVSEGFLLMPKLQSVQLEGNTYYYFRSITSKDRNILAEKHIYLSNKPRQPTSDSYFDF